MDRERASRRQNVPECCITQCNQRRKTQKFQGLLERVCAQNGTNIVNLTKTCAETRNIDSCINNKIILLLQTIAVMYIVIHTFAVFI